MFGYQTSKITAYAIQDTMEKVNGYKQDAIPNVIVFHSLTNDIKNLSSSDYVHQMTASLVVVPFFWVDIFNVRGSKEQYSRFGRLF
jgi:hypothetical protein